MRKPFYSGLKACLVLISFFGCLNIFGQQALPAQYPVDAKVNNIKTWVATAPEADPANLLLRPVTDVKLTTQYSDGLGRQVQSVIKMGSLETGTNNWADIISTNIYDEFGREAYKYLPSPANTTGGNTSVIDGHFKRNPFQQQETFMQEQYGSQNETFYYGQTNFESSPLNRPEKTFAPGNSWVGSDHGIENKYWFNTDIDAVRKWHVTESEDPGLLGNYESPDGEIYAAGELFKNVTIDEKGKQVIEFKDTEGKVILKKIQLNNDVSDDGTGSGYPGWLCTYYIYDDLNNLRCVIQPRGIEIIADAWTLTDPVVINEQCFQYLYDAQNRMVIKKVPGAGETWMIYDNNDRLILTQDANLRLSHKWLYTSYDALNRPEKILLWNNSDDRITLQEQALEAEGSFPNFTGEIMEELMETFYDDYSWLQQYGNPLSDEYDNEFHSYLMPESTTAWPYAQNNLQSYQLKGLQTGSRIKVLGTTGTYLFTVNFYDARGRLIQVQSQNITGGTDISTTQYAWVGQPLIMVQKQENLQADLQSNVIVTKLTYDALSRLVKTEKKASNASVNSGEMPDNYVLISENEYDKLGQLKTKKLDPTYNSGAGLETENYDYNIRRWLLGMNRDYVKDVNTSNHFGFELGYDNPVNIIDGENYSGPQYNGNIGGSTWKSAGDGEKRKYDYIYDNVNRLTGADFNQYTDGNFNKAAGIDFSVSALAYDANGNIQTMSQKGLKLNASSFIDQLNYGYLKYSNKLLSVTDAATNDPNSKLGDFHDGENVDDDYEYDDNGNLTKDLNKKILSITYNYLNLPTQILIPSEKPEILNSIKYVYDAGGNKLQKEVIDKFDNDFIKTTTTYLNGSVYESKLSSINGHAVPGDHNDILQFIPHEEGRIRFKPSLNNSPASLQYDYMIKDHLANVRMVLTEETRQDIYPAATLEGDITTDGSPNAIHKEKAYYNIIPANVKPASDATGISDYENNNDGVVNNNPLSNSTAISDKLYMLQATSGSGGVTGLGITLKVMSGDRIDILGKSYYFQDNTNNTSSYNFQVPLLNILTGFLQGPTASAISESKGALNPSTVSAIPSLSDLAQSLFSDHQDENEQNQTQTKPRAYINYLIFDEQFKCVGKGFSQVGDNSTIKDHFEDLQNIIIPKNGFIYIYCSNESPVKVFFDNLQVVHTRGPILEETHFYPFGLTMAGISSHSAGISENKFGITSKEKQNKEFTNGTGLDLYDFGARMHDPQIGKWLIIDPKAENTFSISPYTFCFNNPNIFVDPDGMLAKYNFDGPNAGNYTDNGVVVNFDYVENQYNLGDHASTVSVFLTQEYGNNKKTYLNNDDYHGVLLKFLNNFLKASKSGETAKIIQAKDSKDAADQIENIDAVIDNIFISSHGYNEYQYFRIGNTSYTRVDQINNDPNLDRIRNKLMHGKGLFKDVPLSTVTIAACFGASSIGKGSAIMQALATKLQAFVFAPLGFCYPSNFSGNSKQHTGDWRAFGPSGVWEKVANSTHIENVSFDNSARIHYTTSPGAVYY